MSTSSRAPVYDLFKLIVAIILLLIFLFLPWLRPAPAPLPEPTITLTAGPPIPSPTGTSASDPLTSTAPPFSSPTGTPTPAPPPTQIPTPTESPAPEPLPTPIVEIPSDTDVCAAVSRARLTVGMNATILRRLNFRSSPGIQNNWILTNRPGTQVGVIGGPTCTRYKNGGAYLWWQIKLPDGQIGWSAEASAFGTFYFMEPIP